MTTCWMSAHISEYAYFRLQRKKGKKKHLFWLLTMFGVVLIISKQIADKLSSQLK